MIKTSDHLLFFFQLNTTVHISKALRKYGKIEQIDVLPEKFPTQDDANEYYAYVTFKEAASAFEAISNQRNLDIFPADTWKQPDYISPPAFLVENNKISLNRLNDDCLIEIFRYMDLETILNLTMACERFNNIICQQIQSIHPKICLNIDIPKISFTLNVIKKLLKHVHYVSFNIDPYIKTLNLIRITDISTKNLNKNLKELELNRFLITKRMHKQMRSILMQLESLKLIYCSSNHDEIDLMSICPKLKTLCLTFSSIFVINSNRWQSLESLTLNHHRITSFPNLISAFLKNNRQLKELKLHLFNENSLINDICKFSCNLEILHLCSTLMNETWHWENLVKLEKLKELEITSAFFETNNNYKHFINILGQLITLEKFTLCTGGSIFYKPEHCQLFMLAKKLINLREFYIVGYFLTVETILAFLEVSPQLKVLQFRDCSLVIGDDLIKSISNLRKEQTEKSNSNVVPLKIYVDLGLEFKDYDEVITIHKIKNLR